MGGEEGGEGMLRHRALRLLASRGGRGGGSIRGRSLFGGGRRGQVQTAAEMDEGVNILFDRFEVDRIIVQTYLV